MIDKKNYRTLCEENHLAKPARYLVLRFFFNIYIGSNPGATPGITRSYYVVVLFAFLPCLALPCALRAKYMYLGNSLKESSVAKE